MSDRAVRVDTTSQVPPYEQIRAQLAALIRTGQMTEGERLPTVRQLAADLGLAPGTVARAYRELEAAELIRTRRGAGTRVAALPSGPQAPDAHQLGTLARDFTSAARALGADTEDILTAVRNALNSDPAPASATAGSGAGGSKTTEASVKVTGVRNRLEQQT
ncbi:GntR family transcriptional regulator [Streptomyces sp. uw30]|uniref:GntR family transcriptional regulator n=1 Tax=Streptomyces sp. uw30 TaxID=1828179 RepID=UPI0011CE36EB|nr:GntR family transcriptional regulator [Streptomyces sp. uw30]TXS51771.1 GntR family transcriptional regulator [Streptomyces sp. uw30]